MSENINEDSRINIIGQSNGALTSRKKRLLLVGAGHAHAGVLREFSTEPLTDVEVILISPSPDVPSSGMLPAWLAGHYRWQEICIDFPSLCKRAGVQFILDGIEALDADQRHISLTSGKMIEYDYVSFNVGPTLLPPSSDASMRVIPLRPLYQLQKPWHDLRATLQQLKAGTSYSILIVGAGAAGVESVLSMQHALSILVPEIKLSFTLVGASTEILDGLAPIAVHRLERRMAQRGIEVVRNFLAQKLGAGTVVAEDGRALKADCVFWATAAQAHRWPRASALLTDDGGFIRINRYLQSRSHDNVFAVGDCSSWETPLPKAGVFAVRMGPVLAKNLREFICGKSKRQSLIPYIPQRRFLTLVGTGDKNAIASWGIFGLEGKWIWRWKQRIDLRFLAEHR